VISAVSAALNTVTVAKPSTCLADESVIFPLMLPCDKAANDTNNNARQMVNFLMGSNVGTATYDLIRRACSYLDKRFLSGMM